MIFKNDFCINTEDHGSVWGTLIDWATANKIAVETNDEYNLDSDKCIRYECNLMDWNTKVYVWLKNYSNGDNLFIELKY